MNKLSDSGQSLLNALDDGIARRLANQETAITPMSQQKVEVLNPISINFKLDKNDILYQQSVNEVPQPPIISPKVVSALEEQSVPSPSRKSLKKKKTEKVPPLRMDLVVNKYAT